MPTTPASQGMAPQRPPQPSRGGLPHPQTASTQGSEQADLATALGSPSQTRSGQQSLPAELGGGGGVVVEFSRTEEHRDSVEGPHQPPSSAGQPYAEVCLCSWPSNAMSKLPGFNIISVSCQQDVSCCYQKCLWRVGCSSPGISHTHCLCLHSLCNCAALPVYTQPSDWLKMAARTSLLSSVVENLRSLMVASVLTYPGILCGICKDSNSLHHPLLHSRILMPSPTIYLQKIMKWLTSLDWRTEPSYVYPTQLSEGLLLLQGGKGFQQGAQSQERVYPKAPVAAVAAEDASEYSNDSGSERRSSGRGRRKPSSRERKLKREREVSKQDSHGCTTCDRRLLPRTRLLWQQSCLSHPNNVEQCEPVVML